MANSNYNQINAQIPTKKWYKKPWGIFLVILLFIILVSLSTFGFYTYSLIKKIKSGEISLDEQWQKALLKPGPYEMENSASAYTGASNPKLTIVEFADFNCPYCKASYPTVREMSLKYKDSVKIIFRHYPVIQEDSLVLALASECANEQNKFWYMHDAFFQNNNPAENISQIASKIGLNASKFNECLKSQKYLNKIKIDFLAAQEANMKGTPTWFINGNKIEGEIPKETFFKIIDAFLAESL
ncbi:MAG: thioredoxin domain-containing protein [Patescibacteria group bacterium]|jgi:predicted DsbA family dithiol-disulfide isomerase